MPHPAQLLSDPRRPYVPQSARANSAPSSGSFTSSPAHLPTSPSSPTAHSPLPTAPSTTSLTFTPTPDQSERLFTAFADPYQTLASIARDHNTTLEAITLWMSRPDIQQRMANMRAAFAERTRFVASNFLPGVSATCHAIIHEFNTDQTHMCFSPTDPNGHEVKRRNRDTARKTGMLLLHLAKYYDVGTPTLRVGSDSPATPPIPAGSSHTSHIRHPKSDIASSSPDLATLIANDPQLAAHLAQAIAAKQAQTLAPALSAPTTPAPAPASHAVISNSKSEIPPASAPTSVIPHPKSDIAPAPKPVPVTLTISARPLTTPAGSPHARAP